MSEMSTNSASSYSTGGGGVTLEHIYAATLLAALAAGDPIGELGDHLIVSSIRLQASDVSPVDDIVVDGSDSDENFHRVSIGVRRDPRLTRSEKSSVSLIRSYLQIVIDNWVEVSAGAWSLALAVATNRPAHRELGELATLARSAPDCSSFGSMVTRAGATNADVRKRLEHFTELVEQAALGIDRSKKFTTAELTWRLLSALKVRALRLEGADLSDRTEAVNSLRRVVTDELTATADSVFLKIVELAGTWAAHGAVITEPMLRRELSGYGLKRSATHARSWAVFDRLAVRLRDSIRPKLGAGAQSLELDRPSEKSRLVEAMRAAGSSGGALVVTGDPDVGKSALALRVVEALRGEGAAVTLLSLRDLPSRVADFESELDGASVDDVLATGELTPTRLILIDGAESVLEGKDQLFRTIAAAALNGGIGVVAITRTDGARKVQDDLRRAGEVVSESFSPTKHVVGSLAEDERRALPAIFPALTRLGEDSRADWLLGRLGLVDVLLQTGEDINPASILCEADVFSIVWRSLIRNDERYELGAASPDDREEAALNVAKRTLGTDAAPPHGRASVELRSDGVLRAPYDIAFSQGDEFATDLFRDFALCRLFITQGWPALASANAPRWSIRAVRLACQAALLSRDRLSAWAELSTQFGEIARTQGDRWSEIPYEALLTLGDAESALRELWETLTANNCSELVTLLRLAQARYVSGIMGDAFALASIVKVTFCEERSIDSSVQLGHQSVQEIIQDIVLAWLREIARSRPETDQLRQNVRDRILDNNPPLYDDFAIEALATLGPDIDDRTDAWLRGVAQGRPGNLSPAVESFVVAISMAQARPKLLLDLAEAYYIKLPRPRGPFGGSMDRFDDGIRDFQHGLGFGFGAPQAAWYYGPFFRLLQVIPVDTIGLINRMLDHAASVRVKKLSNYSDEPGETKEPEGIDLSLPEASPRRYVGDSSVWAWYRGTSVGPYPCMSALLALEQFIDHLLEKCHLPAQTIMKILLHGCHNLAIPGLLVGFLTRHLDFVGDLLDAFLEHPEVWHLESSRVAGEHFTVRDPHADKLTGGDRRGHTPHQTVGTMLVNALLRADQERLAALEGVGARLVEKARLSLTGAAGDDQYIAMVEGWAAQFQTDNYQATQGEDGVIVQFELPEPVEHVLAPRNQELQMTSTLYGFQNRYGRFNDAPAKWPIDNLVEDLTTARDIAGGEIPHNVAWPENSLVVVAAAAVRAHVLGLVAFDSGDLIWAIEAVMEAAENPHVDHMSHEHTIFPMGADRAAAVAAPLLLLAPFDDLSFDRDRLQGCLRACAESLFDEVRAAYATGCMLVWLAPCDHDPAPGHCIRHQPAWDTASGDLANCKLGPWDYEMQSRSSDPLPTPFHQTLPTVKDDALLVNRLRMPLMCMVDARSVPCLEGAVDDLWIPLWDAHRRGLGYWWKQGYDHHAYITHEPIARRMIESVLNNDRESVRTHIADFADNANALHLLFQSFATVFTYDKSLLKSLTIFWPWALEIALNAIGDGSALRSEHHWFDYMAASLLPVPHLKLQDSDIDGTLERCRQDWIHPDALAGLDQRWLCLVRWEPKAVDAVIGLAKSAPLEWQTNVALTWIETIIDGRFDLFVNRLWLLEDWLLELHGGGAFVGEVKNQYHRIIDGLAAAGDRAAVGLQQLDE